MEPEITKVGGNVKLATTGQSKSYGKESGVSRLSVGFRHLIDWSRETRTSVTTESGLGQGIGGAGSNLEAKFGYDMKAGQASGLPGGGFPRAEAAIFTGLSKETLGEAGYSHTPTWFNRYVRQMEYLVAEQSGEFGHYSGSDVSPSMPTRRWIYGIPSKQPARHTAQDANQPIFEALLKKQTNIDSGDKSSEVNQIYTSIYINMLSSLNQIQPKEMENLIRFLMKRDYQGEDLTAMGSSMLTGLMKDPAFDGKVDEEVEKLIATRFGGEKGEGKREGMGAAKSRQEILAILSKIGVVVTTGHGKLGGAEPMDVLFNKPQTIKYPDPDTGPREITIRLADISEEDWTKPGHHGTGTGKAQMNTRSKIKEHYNDPNKGRIVTYNNLIRLVRKFVDIKTEEAGLPGKGTAGAGKKDLTWDAWYRRRATQIASDIQQGVDISDKSKARTGAGAAQRGRQDLLRLELAQFIAENEALAAQGFMDVEKISKEDLKHVLHHMGSANAVYDALYDDAQMNFPVNEYGEMIAYDQNTDPPEEFTVIINFRINKRGLVEKLKLKDIAIVKQSLADIFISFWAQESGLTKSQMYEAWDLATTVSGMTKFASYFAEQVGIATAIPGSERKRFTVRADAAIPGYMDDLMYMFFHGGNDLMKRGIAELLNDMDRIAKSYSSTLRTTLWGQLRNRWPTYAWGSQHGKYGQGNTSRTHSDEKHPPTGLFHQDFYDIDFGGAKQFWPQLTKKGAEAGPQPFKEAPMDPEGRKRRSRKKPLSEEEFARDKWGAVAEDMGLYTEAGKIVYGETDMDTLGQGSRAAGPKDREREWKLPGTPWWTAAPVMWTPRHTIGPNIPAKADSLDFVWAAPYVTWQHYQMSGSVK